MPAKADIQVGWGIRRALDSRFRSDFLGLDDLSALQEYPHQTTGLQRVESSSADFFAP